MTSLGGVTVTFPGICWTTPTSRLLRLDKPSLLRTRRHPFSLPVPVQETVTSFSVWRVAVRGTTTAK